RQLRNRQTHGSQPAASTSSQKILDLQTIERRLERRIPRQRRYLKLNSPDSPAGSARGQGISEQGITANNREFASRSDHEKSMGWLARKREQGIAEFRPASATPAPRHAGSSP